LTACNSSGSSLQNALAPDPKLKDNPVGFSASPQPSPSSSSSSPSLPKDFPLYPQAKLTSSEQTPDRGIVTNWTSNDAIDKIQAFYQQELPTKQWQILSKPSNADEDLVAEQQQIQVKIGYNPDVKATESGVTNFTITYLDKNAAASSSPSPFIAPAANNSPSPNAIATNRDYLADLTQLGILNSADNNKNKIVTRREYARWLVAAYPTNSSRYHQRQTSLSGCTYQSSRFPQHSRVSRSGIDTQPPERRRYRRFISPRYTPHQRTVNFMESTPRYPSSSPHCIPRCTQADLGFSGCG
jgi:hypothetical protein